MEHTSELVEMGKLIHEIAYPQRSEKYSEIEFNGIKIDYFDPRNKIIHEIKKSDTFEEADEWQIKFYIYVLEQNGVKGATGILEYPRLKDTRKIIMTDSDRKQIDEFEKDIQKIITSDICPERLLQKRCKNCSYFDFCWSDEQE